MFDLEMIKATYAKMADRIASARKVTNKPLTLTEKKLYSPCQSYKNSVFILR